MPVTPVTPPRPPVAAIHPHVRSHHGHEFVDDYEWLRDRNDPAVTAYLTAENDYADAVTAHLGELRSTLFAEIRGRVQEDDMSVPVASGPWWYYARTITGEEYAVHARSPRVPGQPRPVLDGTTPISGEQILVDENALARGHEFFALGALSISPDHRLVAYAVDVLGDERFALRVKDIATGEVLDDVLSDVGYGAVFSLDGDWVFHTRVDDAWRPFQVWRHLVGGDPADDVLVLEEADERFWLSLDSSRDDRWIVMSLGSKDVSETWLLDAAEPTTRPWVVAPRRQGLEYDVEPARDRLLVVHNDRSPDFDLAWAPLDPELSHRWQPVLESAAGERFLGADSFDDFAVLSLRKDGLTALRLLFRDSGEESGFVAGDLLEFDEPVRTVRLGSNPETATSTIQVVLESLVTPRSVFEVDVTSRELTLLKRQPVLGGHDPNDYVQHRLWATATDGIEVPISLVARVGAVPDGTNPGWLTAYGSYEISNDPYFSVARLSLLDRGVVYAMAHVRGGGEMGRGWYEQGRREHKKNTFTDFIACADHLVESGWVAGDRLAASGGSAGGLLMGAVANLAPERFRVIEADVPFVDALTTILRPDLPLTVTEWEEWGNPLADPGIYAYMRSYSPYENVRTTAYPAILATTSLNDTRVYFTEPAKWVARLRATATNDPLTRPILLRTEMVAGHGGRSGRYAGWEQTAWEWAFMLDQLGLGTATATSLPGD